MPADFLLEIGTEELPPAALKSLALALRDGIEAGLTQRELAFHNTEWFATPRRLAVRVHELAEQAPQRQVEHLGPPLQAARDESGAWTKAAEGFARKHRLSPDQLTEVDSPKGARLAYRESREGARAERSLAAVVEAALAALPIPKRMRWGSSRTEFIRPVHWVLMLLGDQVPPGEVLGMRPSNSSRGHRFHCNHDLEIPRPQDYQRILETEGRVLVDFEGRRQWIRDRVENLAGQLGGRADLDPELLDEVTALVEWPAVLNGSFDQAFLAVPSEALIYSMKEHQKYFPVTDAEGRLLPHFIFVANIDSRDPAQVVAGNERVIRPRLGDAAFFFDTDRQTPLADRVEGLDKIVFQEKLGSLLDKTHRVEALSQRIAEQTGAEPEATRRATHLAKADLGSEMVLEFDKMQGLAGHYYARHDGEKPVVAEAIRDQYLPRFAGDRLPETSAGCALALADRLDTLVGIFGIGQPPSGSKDPFALRRASVAVLRILVEKALPLDLAELLEQARGNYRNLPQGDQVVEQVLAYMIERFRAWYEEADIPVQVFQAVSAKQVTVPLDFHRRVEAVHAFYRMPEAEALASANKRVANILAKQDQPVTGQVDPKLLQEEAERQLAAELAEKETEVYPLFEQQQYDQGLKALASLRESVDRFFDQVMVMTEERELRDNRLRLLAQLHGLFLAVADISLLSAAK